MKIIICGAGRVGYGIARQLATEDNQITVIDQSEARVRRISEQLDVTAFVGHGAHPDTLNKAGAAEADMIIAVTFHDEVNMVAAQVAHSIFAVPMKIARIRSQSYLKPRWADLFSRDHMPIDVIISPELEVAKSVLRRLEVPGGFMTRDFSDGKVQLVGVRLDDNCPIVDTALRQLTELFPDLRAIVTGISRDGHLFVPKPSDQMLIGDNVYLVAETSHLTRTLDIFGHEEKEARRVVILGGGNIARNVAKSLEDEHSGVNVKIVELDKATAETAADSLSRTVVIHGDALDQDILKEAGVAEAETVVAITNKDQVNILSCVLSRKMGADRTLALINNHEYSGLSASLGITAFIDPRATTVSTILQHVRRGRIRDLYSLEQGAAEVIEAVALDTSPLVGKPLKDSEIPDGIIIGAVVRKGEVIIPRADTIFESGDHIIVFAQKDMVRKAERMFRVSLELF